MPGVLRHQKSLPSWQSCASLNSAMKVRIPGLKKYQDRNPHGYLQDLDCSARQRAYYWLGVFRKRWSRSLPPSRFAIICKQPVFIEPDCPEPSQSRHRQT